MRYNTGGFLRPAAQAALEGDIEAAILRACPGIGIPRPPAEQDPDPVWGPLASLHLVHAADEQLRFQASSGGALSALLCRLLEDDLVDAVLHVGADRERPIANAAFISETPADVQQHAGSRYSPSAPLAELAVLAASGRRYALVGKPCDIAAARAYAREHPQVSRSFPYMISFFCGGIPSTEGARAILQKLRVAESELTEFRYRGCGWPGYVRATSRDGQEHTMSYDESWGKILNRHLQLRCKICPDSTGELADVVCADGWHLDADGNPDFAEHPGRSIVIARTPRGEALVERCFATGTLAGGAIDRQQLARMQPYQANRKRLVFSRIIAMKLFGLRSPNYPLAYLGRLALGAGLRANLRSFGGMLLRAGRYRLKNRSNSGRF